MWLAQHTLWRYCLVTPLKGRFKSCYKVQTTSAGIEIRILVYKFSFSDVKIYNLIKTFFVDTVHNTFEKCFRLY